MSKIKIPEEVSYTVWEASRRLGVSVHTLREMLRRGEISGFKLLDQWRVPDSAITSYITEHSNAAAR